MTASMLTDSAIRRALAPAPDVLAPADFTIGVAEVIGRTRQRSSWLPVGPDWSTSRRLLVQAVLLALLLVLLIVALLVVGGLPAGNGRIVLVDGNRVMAIEPGSGVESELLVADGEVSALTRSPDGRWVSFWIGSGSDRHLEIMRADGSDRQTVAREVVPSPVGGNGVDLWSPDSHSLAAQVSVDGNARILIVDVADASGRLIGPDSGAETPLWSNDGEWLAFRTRIAADRWAVAVMHPDGTGVRVISGYLRFSASGANDWSPDDEWIYFDAGIGRALNIFRANVLGGFSEQITTGAVDAAPALSPNGEIVAYVDFSGDVPDLYVIAADGSGLPELVLERAFNLGWSADGRYLLSEWYPLGESPQLVAIDYETRQPETLLTCSSGTCSAGGISWGRPRP
ncbi:MAG: hypothetical protein ABIZ34_07630 [Candidatus Limnocylindrales bacterium]